MNKFKIKDDMKRRCLDTNFNLLVNILNIYIILTYLTF